MIDVLWVVMTVVLLALAVIGGIFYLGTHAFWALVLFLVCAPLATIGSIVILYAVAHLARM
ncbi:MAG: hypothetical protein KGL39_09545 [Patescibacteria group bacterium]|nr:hypothetical protein [Patescibacteria group bacterium]